MSPQRDRARRFTAVLFDFGGTLDAPGLAWKERVFDLYRSEGVAVAADEFARCFYDADDALVGTIPVTTSFRDVVHRLVAGVSVGLKVDDERVTDRVANRFVEDARLCANDSARVLAELGRHYRLGVVSNFYGNLATVCEDLGLRVHLDAIVDSVDVGCVKPDPRIFRHALDRLGVGAPDAVFVGDSLARDMAGARDVGVEHVWLVAAATSRPTPCCANDRIIRSLGDLRGELLP
jgi:HAD superfamily hydrolase (TIGR01549 family)